MNRDDPSIGLRAEIERLLAAALHAEQRHDDAMRAAEQRHTAELDRRDDLHIAETHRRDRLHVAELGRRDDVHARELEMIRTALETRDVIGQAKGVIMATMCVSPDEAFALLRTQSQHENVKLVDIAVEIAKRAATRSPDGSVRPDVLSVRPRPQGRQAGELK